MGLRREGARRFGEPTSGVSPKPDAGIPKISGRDRMVSKHQVKNQAHSVLLFAGMLLLCSVLGWLIFGLLGVLVLGVSMSLLLLVGPFVSPQLILKMYRARRLTEQEAPSLHRQVRSLAARAGLRLTPPLYYVPSSIANAVTVGASDKAAIALTDGLLRNLSVREVNGVLAHELSHVKNGDGWVMSLADLVSQLVNTMSWIGQLLLIINLPLFLMGALSIPWLIILLLIFAPTLSALLQLALSRTREYEADLDAARLTGDPRGLASALAKLERMSGSLFETILFPGRRVPEPSLLRSHPPTEERIQRLLELEEELAPGPEERAHDLYRDVRSIPVRIVRGPRWHSSGLWY
ncbi:MAG: M48 family metalloprotease [Desulfomonile tiedjei]|nr:M48 family metalloprotease [Desulfomonile tiedjei]